MTEFLVCLFEKSKQLPIEFSQNHLWMIVAKIYLSSHSCIISSYNNIHNDLQKSFTKVICLVRLQMHYFSFFFSLSKYSPTRPVMQRYSSENYLLSQILLSCPTLLAYNIDICNVIQYNRFNFGAFIYLIYWNWFNLISFFVLTYF